MKIRNFLAYIILGMLSLESALFGKMTSGNFLNACPFQAQMQKMQFYSQASQDKFVYGILYGLLGKQDQGYYLEIGAGEPINMNNTYFFEKNLGWEGISIDISQYCAQKWYSTRSNSLLIEDATKSNFAAILQSFPPIIDYLSLDVDEFYTDVLKRLPFNDYTFKIITIEHDVYRLGDQYRVEERQILTSLGYHMLCPDVSNQGCVFEDWWIHPSAFSPFAFSVLTALNLNNREHSQLIQVIENANIFCGQN